MSVVSAVLMCHAPIVIPAIGAERAPQWAVLTVHDASGRAVARFRGVFRGLMPTMELFGYVELPPGSFRVDCVAEGGLRGSIDVTADGAGGKQTVTMPLSR